LSDKKRPPNLGEGVVDKQIDLFNLKAPVACLQHPRLRIEQEIEQFLKNSR
jgi:hypothetical protein